MSNLIIERQSAAHLLVDCGNVDTTSWTPPAGMTFEQWSEIGRRFQKVSTSINWWIGDWLNEGERRYGEKYTQAIEVTGGKLEYLQNCSWVSRAVKSSTRVELLSWSHHRHVAHLPEDAQRALLEAAVEYDLTAKELKEAVDDYLANLNQQARTVDEKHPEIKPIASVSSEDIRAIAERIREINRKRWVVYNGASLPVIMQPDEHASFAIYGRVTKDAADWWMADHCLQVQKQAMRLRDLNNWPYSKYTNYYTALRIEVCTMYNITAEAFEAHAETSRLWPQEQRRQNETVTYRHHYLLRNRTEDREYYLQQCTINEWSAERLAEELKGQRP